MFRTFPTGEGNNTIYKFNQCQSCKVILHKNLKIKYHIKVKRNTQQSRVKIKLYIFHVIMVKVSHNNVNVVIRVSVLKVTSTIVFVGLQTFTMGGGMHGPF